MDKIVNLRGRDVSFAAGNGGGGGASAGIVETTYEQLKALRDAGKLIKGAQYRITDYECIIDGMDARSAGHQFDVIVTANSENVLSENAKAIQTKLKVESDYYRFFAYAVIEGQEWGGTMYAPNKSKDEDAIHLGAEQGEMVKAYAWEDKLHIFEFDLYTLTPTPTSGDDVYIKEEEGGVSWLVKPSDYSIIIKQTLTDKDINSISMSVEGTNFVATRAFPLDKECRFGNEDEVWKQGYAWIVIEEGIVVYTLTETPQEGEIIYFLQENMYEQDALFPISTVAKLNEESVAKGYFDGCNLAAWELKYCLDNDKSRFQWAKNLPSAHVPKVLNIPQGLLYFYEVKDYGSDGCYAVYRMNLQDEGEEYILMDIEWMPILEAEAVSNLYISNDWDDPVPATYADDVEWVTTQVVEGKGVIYYMKDEYGNECPYDFKNIMFKRWHDAGKYNNNNTGNEIWCYTFCVNALYADGFDSYDLTVDEKVQKLVEDANVSSRVKGNVIKESRDRHWYKQMELPNVVFVTKINYLLDFGGWNHNYIGHDSWGTSFFGELFADNVLSSDNRNNIFYDQCSSNRLGDSCSENIFDSSSDNTLMQHSMFNTLKNSNYNILQMEVMSCVLQSHSLFNILGIGCQDNTLTGAQSVVLGKGCQNNTIESSRITMGYYVRNCSIPKGCDSITFGNVIDRVTLSKSYMKNIVVEDGVANVIVTCSASTSSFYNAVNARIRSGVKGASSSSMKTCSIPTVNNEFLTIFGTSKDTVINV